MRLPSIIAEWALIGIPTITAGASP
jgi:hypothetical protein